MEEGLSSFPVNKVLDLGERRSDAVGARGKWTASMSEETAMVRNREGERGRERERGFVGERLPGLKSIECNVWGIRGRRWIGPHRCNIGLLSDRVLSV